MTRRKIDKSLLLTRKIGLRVSDPFYKKMERWLDHSNCQTMAQLTRTILYKEEIIWYHKNAELESTAIELAGIRKELNAIGRNINQITRSLHATDIPHQKVTHAARASEEFKKVGLKVDQLLKLVSEISKAWLQK